MENKTIHEICKCCQKGEKNEYGDVWFESLPCKLRGNFSHDRPQILKRNGMYFLIVENFSMIKIRSCPICGRIFESSQEINKEPNPSDN